MLRLPLLLVALATSLFVHADEVRVVGSDLLGKPFSDALTAYAVSNDLGVTLSLAGSRVGLEQLKAGKGDLAIVMMAPGEQPPADDFVALPAAYLTAVLVVPASLPLTQITYDQLNTIYADGAQSGLARWADLGVTGDWAQRSILPNILGPSGGLSYDLFRYTVLSSPALRPTVGVQSSLSESLTRIRGEEGGLVVLPLLPAKQDRLKTLLVARGAKDVAFGPSAENIHSGDYPIRLPVYLVFRKESAKGLRPALRYLLSEDGAALWQNAQLVPLPVQARNQQVLDLDVL